MNSPEVVIFVMGRIYWLELKVSKHLGHFTITINFSDSFLVVKNKTKGSIVFLYTVMP